MKLELLKKIPADLLPGLTLDSEFRDGQLKAIEIFDGDGALVAKIAACDSYEMSVKVFVPAKPKLVDKWTVRGSVLGLPVDEQFENQWDANNRKGELIGRLEEEKFEIEVALSKVEEKE
jgi:hypothetical protein